MVGWIVVLVVLLGLFTPTWVVAWQVWSSRLSGQRRSLPPRVLSFPQPRPPS